MGSMADSSKRFQHKNGGSGFFVERDGMARHEFSTAADFCAAVEVFNLIASLRIETA